MARVRIERISEGQHPSEVVVAVRTSGGGIEKLVVDRRSISDDTLDIGYPVGQDEGKLLVELPRESTRGLWRVWVDPDAIEGMAA